MFVYKFQCAQELTERFTGIIALIIPFKAKSSMKRQNKNLKSYPPSQNILHGKIVLMSPLN